MPDMHRRYFNNESENASRSRLAKGVVVTVRAMWQQAPNQETKASSLHAADEHNTCISGSELARGATSGGAIAYPILTSSAYNSRIYTGPSSSDCLQPM